MPVYSFAGAPAEVRELLVRSRDEGRAPEAVRDELARLGVNPTLQVLYLRDGLGLPLEQAKRVVTSADEPDEAQAEEMSSAICEALADDTTRRRK